MNILILNKFLTWWERKTTTWIIIMAVIQVAQIPHMIWNGDLYLASGYVSHINPVADFILFGIDLLETPTILIAFTTIVARIKKKKRKQQ